MHNFLLGASQALFIKFQGRIPQTQLTNSCESYSIACGAMIVLNSNLHKTTMGHPNWIVRFLAQVPPVAITLVTGRVRAELPATRRTPKVRDLVKCSQSPPSISTTKKWPDMACGRELGAFGGDKSGGVQLKGVTHRHTVALSNQAL